MHMLESPSISEGVEAWRQWHRKLESMPAARTHDESVKMELIRAQRVIKMFEQFPNGMDARHPDFLKTVRAFVR